MGKALVLAMLLLFGGSASAREAAPAAEDPGLEQRVMAVAAELRCLVCQNQSIAESDSDLAKDLRDQVREQLRQGWDERDVVDFMVARYGDFVLWRPPFKLATLLLWFGPLLLLIAGLVALYYRLVRERDAGGTELSDAERARAARMLEFRSDKEMAP